jgi:gamma-glutamyl:cysteine ligase YbdK (ATP-grasp superfamily)
VAGRSKHASFRRLAGAGNPPGRPLQAGSGRFAVGRASQSGLRITYPRRHRGPQYRDPHHELDALLSAPHPGTVVELTLLGGHEDRIQVISIEGLRALPADQHPRRVCQLAEYETFINLLVKTNCVDNGKKVWWDIRPHPFFNTLEVRVCDIPMRLDETMAIAALIQATVGMLYDLHAKNKSYRIYSRALIMENKFRAARYGIDGKLIDFGREEEVPMRDLMIEYIDLISDSAKDLGCERDIAYIHEMLRMGTGADRQLKVYEETGDLKKVVDYIVAETRVGVMQETAALQS